MNYKLLPKALIAFTLLGAVVAAYTQYIALPENYLGQKMSSKSHYRLDVWTKTQAGWQIIAHANLNPI